MNNLRLISKCYKMATKINIRPQICINYLFQSNNPYSSTPIAQPVPEGANREYPPKIQNIVSEISKLTLLEVSELNELLKTTLKIPDAPVMAYNVANGAPVAAEEEQDKEEKVVKTSFAVKLLKYDTAKKVQLIKEMKSLVAGMNLVQAKKFVESLPQVVKSDLSKDEAEKMSEAIKAAGGECEIE